MIPLVCQPTVPAITLPLVGSILGALAGSYELGSKVDICPLASVGWPKKEYRRPAYMVSRGLTLKSSCAYSSCCHAHTFGVISCEGWVNAVSYTHLRAHETDSY